MRFYGGGLLGLVNGSGAFNTELEAHELPEQFDGFATWPEDTVVMSGEAPMLDQDSSRADLARRWRPDDDYLNGWLIGIWPGRHDQIMHRRERCQLRVRPGAQNAVHDVGHMPELRMHIAEATEPLQDFRPRNLIEAVTPGPGVHVASLPDGATR
jgi:hypothetical protein